MFQGCCAESRVVLRLQGLHLRLERAKFQNRPSHLLHVAPHPFLHRTPAAVHSPVHPPGGCCCIVLHAWGNRLPRAHGAAGPAAASGTPRAFAVMWTIRTAPFVAAAL